MAQGHPIRASTMYMQLKSTILKDSSSAWHIQFLQHRHDFYMVTLSRFFHRKPHLLRMGQLLAFLAKMRADAILKHDKTVAIGVQYKTRRIGQVMFSV